MPGRALMVIAFVGILAAVCMAPVAALADAEMAPAGMVVVPGGTYMPFQREKTANTSPRQPRRGRSRRCGWMSSR